MKITGNLEILTAEDARKYANVTKVGGWLDISAAGASLPALTSVGEWLDILAAGASLPALAEVGGGLDIRAAGASLPLLGRVIAWDGKYALFRRHDGRYCAGCRQRMTRDDALAHWNRDDRRAKMFTKAIKKEPK